MRSPPCWSRSAASRRRRSGSTPASRSARHRRPRVPRRPSDRRAPRRPTERTQAMTARSRVRHRQLGDGVRRDAGRRRQRRCGCGAGAPRWSTRSTRGSNADYLPGLELPDGDLGHDRPGRGGRAAPRSSCSRCRRRRCGPTSRPGPACCPADAAVVSLMKGVELGTTKRMSEVIAEVGRGRAASGSSSSPVPTWPSEIAAHAAGRQRRGLRRRGDVAELVAEACATAVLPALHQHRRHRHRARRRGEERHRARRRHGRGHGHGRQHQGVAHHPRAGRDRPARRRRWAPTR